MKARVTLALAAAAVLAGKTEAVQIQWTDWQAQSNLPGGGKKVTGSIVSGSSTIAVEYTNPVGISFLQTGALGEIDYWTPRTFATSPYTSTAVDNAPTGTDIIALQYATSQTLTFSEAIANPVFSYVSLNGNGYGFDQDFEILSVGGVDGNAAGYWGSGTSSKNIVTNPDGSIEYQLLGTGEPHGTIRFLGAFSSVTWKSLNNENWNGFTVGVEGTAAQVFPTPDAGATALLLGLGFAGLACRRRTGAR